MQEPGSPLVPLDPSRLQQQMQQPMRETVARTISTSSVGSLESAGGHYMEMQAPSTPQFQQSPQFSPLPASQQRFWNSQPSPRSAYQQQQNYGQMIRIPISSQQSQNSQSPRIPLMGGPLAQAISPDMVNMSSPGSVQSPMGSPVQPQPPQNLTPSAIQQQQPMMYQQQVVYQQQQQMLQSPYQQGHVMNVGGGQQQPVQQQQQFSYGQASSVVQQQAFSNQPTVVRQQVTTGRMMAPPGGGQNITGQRVLVSQSGARFVQSNQAGIQQNVYGGPGGQQQASMMYAIQQQQRMPPTVAQQNQPGQQQQQYQQQHIPQAQFSGYPSQQQQYNMSVSGQPNTYIQQIQQQQIPHSMTAQQQQAAMQQMIPGSRYPVQQSAVPVSQQQMMQQQQQPAVPPNQQQTQQQQNLHFSNRQPHPMSAQQYHQYSMQMQQQYNVPAPQQQSSQSVNQQQQPGVANAVVQQQSSQQQSPVGTPQQQQIMYQGSSPLNGPAVRQQAPPPPSVMAARQAAASYYNTAGPQLPTQPAVVQMGHVTMQQQAAPGMGCGVVQGQQPGPPPYCGHDSNINVPPDMCLLGCVFLIVDYDRILDQKEVSDWRTVIVQHGGEVETSYSGKCSHVICESMKHPVVQQAMKESKRCVTAQWLNDCILTKRMQPPWRSVHFPSPFGDNKPCKNRIFSVCGFDANERSCLKQMIMAVGARYTTYLSRHNTLLIAKYMEGQQKVVKAKEWKIPIVNVHWLTELFLGQQAVAQNMNNPKYLQFLTKEAAQHTNIDLFRIEPSISPVLHLMAAWRNPITLSSESWKLASDRKQKLEEDCKLFPYKKIKLSPAPEDDEIENHRKESQNQYTVESMPKICFTGLYQAEVENLTKKALWLNAVIVQDVKECTHLVASDLKRTRKLLESIALGRFIVTPLWIRQSYKQQHFADCIDYIIKDEGNEKFFGFNVKLSIYRARTKHLFENMHFNITPSVQPYPSTLIDLIQTSGGTVMPQRPASARIAELQQSGIQIVIITCENDLHLCQHLLELGIAVHSAEFVLTGILRQEVDFMSYRIEPKQSDVSKPGRET